MKCKLDLHKYVFSLNIFYLHKSCKWDRTQVITTLVKSLPFYKTINKK